MSQNFVLKISAVDRDILVRAMEAMRDEYERIAETMQSSYLANGFRTDGVSFYRLIFALRSLASREELDARVAENLRAGNKINAIKAVREVTSWGLKEAKDYVDGFDWRR